MESILFEHLEIFEINGSSRKTFEGEYTSEALAQILIDEWIPYYECHKCGKGDYCKYTIPDKGNPLRKLDIKCGVAVNALKNFIDRTFFVLDNSSNKKKQNYLDSAFYFCMYILQSEQWNGSFIDNAKLDWWGEHSVKFFGQIIPIRDTLNEFGNCLKEFPELFDGTSLLLVEGESELAFVKNLRADGAYSRAWNFIAHSYGGKGNKLPRRIQMLLDDYKKKGYAIYIQGDEDGSGDGSGYDKFKKYIDEKYLPKEHIFQFNYDFETSIPKKLLYNILKILGYFKDVNFEDFTSISEGKPMNTCLKNDFNIDTENQKLKIKIARHTGKAVFHIDHKLIDKFKETELGQFVTFIENIK